MITGFTPGEMVILASGRRTGKSVWAQMVQDLTMPDIDIIDSAEVDGKTWYTVKLSMPARAWVREQPKEHWVELGTRRQGFFDISGQLYTALKLKF